MISPYVLLLELLELDLLDDDDELELLLLDDDELRELELLEELELEDDDDDELDWLELELLLLEDELEKQFSPRTCHGVSDIDELLELDDDINSP